MFLNGMRLTSHCKTHFIKMGVNHNQFYKLMSRVIYRPSNVICIKSYNAISNCKVPVLDNQASVSLLIFRKYAKKGGSSKKAKGTRTKMVLSEEEMMDVVNVIQYRNDLQEIVNKLKEDFVEHLSLRTSAGTVDSLPVKIDDEEFPLNELAQISRKNPNLIAINMAGFPEGLKPAIQAINESGLGLNPQQEGTMIYLPIPKVTREFREKLAKNAKVIFMTSKDRLRDIQNNYIKNAKKMTDLSEDVVFSVTQQLMSIAEDYANEAENIMKTKQKDLLGEK